jgi:hypothetical protein
MKENIRKVKLEEMEKVNGGMVVGSNILIIMMGKSKERGQRKEIHERTVEAQNLADIRVRASENELRAAMRIDAQERAIKEQMAANRIVFD